MKNPIRLTSTLKTLSLVALCTAVAPALAQDVGTDGTAFVRVMPGKEQWVDYKGDGAAFGIKQAFIFGDPAKPGLYILRIKYPPGVMSTPHAHPETRIGTVIQGTWWTGTGDKLDPATTVAIGVGGMMVHPAGKTHFDGARNEEAIVEIVGIGPTGKKTVDPKQAGFTRVEK